MHDRQGSSAQGGGREGQGSRASRPSLPPCTYCLLFPQPRVVITARPARPPSLKTTLHNPTDSPALDARDLAGQTKRPESRTPRRSSSSVAPRLKSRAALLMGKATHPIFHFLGSLLCCKRKTGTQTCTHDGASRLSQRIIISSSYPGTLCWAPPTTETRHAAAATKTGSRSLWSPGRRGAQTRQRQQQQQASCGGARRGWLAATSGLMDWPSLAYNPYGTCSWTTPGPPPPCCGSSRWPPPPAQASGGRWYFLHTYFLCLLCGELIRGHCLPLPGHVCHAPYRAAAGGAQRYARKPQPSRTRREQQRNSNPSAKRSTSHHAYVAWPCRG